MCIQQQDVFSNNVTFAQQRACTFGCGRFTGDVTKVVTPACEMTTAEPCVSLCSAATCTWHQQVRIAVPQKHRRIPRRVKEFWLICTEGWLLKQLLTPILGPSKPMSRRTCDQPLPWARLHGPAPEGESGAKPELGVDGNQD